MKELLALMLMVSADVLGQQGNGKPEPTEWKVQLPRPWHTVFKENVGVWPNRIEHTIEVQTGSTTVAEIRDSHKNFLGTSKGLGIVVDVNCATHELSAKENRWYVNDRLTEDRAAAKDRVWTRIARAHHGDVIANALCGSSEANDGNVR